MSISIRFTLFSYFYLFLIVIFAMATTSEFDQNQLSDELRRLFEDDKARDEVEEKIVEKLRQFYSQRVQPFENESFFNALEIDQFTVSDIDRNPILLILSTDKYGQEAILDCLFKLDDAFSSEALNSIRTPSDSLIQSYIFGRTTRQIISDPKVVSRFPFSLFDSSSNSALSSITYFELNNRLLKRLDIIDTIVSQSIDDVQQDDLKEVIKNLVNRADFVWIVFNPYQTVINDAFKEILNELRGRNRAVRLIMHSPDSISIESDEIVKAIGQLVWFIEPLLTTRRKSPNLYLINNRKGKKVIDDRDRLLLNLVKILNDVVEVKISRLQRHVGLVQDHVNTVQSYVTALSEHEKTFLSDLTFQHDGGQDSDEKSNLYQRFFSKYRLSHFQSESGGRRLRGKNLLNELNRLIRSIRKQFALSRQTGTASARFVRPQRRGGGDSQKTSSHKRRQDIYGFEDTSVGYKQRKQKTVSTKPPPSVKATLEPESVNIRVSEKQRPKFSKREKEATTGSEKGFHTRNKKPSKSGGKKLAQEQETENSMAKWQEKISDYFAKFDVPQLLSNISDFLTKILSSMRTSSGETKPKSINKVIKNVDGEFSFFGSFYDWLGSFTGKAAEKKGGKPNKYRKKREDLPDDYWVKHKKGITPKVDEGFIVSVIRNIISRTIGSKLVEEVDDNRKIKEKKATLVPTLKKKTDKKLPDVKEKNLADNGNGEKQKPYRYRKVREDLPPDFLQRLKDAAAREAEIKNQSIFNQIYFKLFGEVKQIEINKTKEKPYNYRKRREDLPASFWENYEKHKTNKPSYLSGPGIFSKISAVLFPNISEAEKPKNKYRKIRNDLPADFDVNSLQKKLQTVKIVEEKVIDEELKPKCNKFRKSCQAEMAKIAASKPKDEDERLSDVKVKNLKASKQGGKKEEHEKVEKDQIPNLVDNKQKCGKNSYRKSCQDEEIKEKSKHNKLDPQSDVKSKNMADVQNIATAKTDKSSKDAVKSESGIESKKSDVDKKCNKFRKSCQQQSDASEQPKHAEESIDNQSVKSSRQDSKNLEAVNVDSHEEDSHVTEEQKIDSAILVANVENEKLIVTEKKNKWRKVRTDLPSDFWNNKVKKDKDSTDGGGFLKLLKDTFTFGAKNDSEKPRNKYRIVRKDLPPDFWERKKEEKEQQSMTKKEPGMFSKLFQSIPTITDDKVDSLEPKKNKYRKIRDDLPPSFWEEYNKKQAQEAAKGSILTRILASFSEETTKSDCNLYRKSCRDSLGLPPLKPEKLEQDKKKKKCRKKKKDPQGNKNKA